MSRGTYKVVRTICAGVVPWLVIPQLVFAGKACVEPGSDCTPRARYKQQCDRADVHSQQENAAEVHKSSLIVDSHVHPDRVITAAAAKSLPVDNILRLAA